MNYKGLGVLAAVVVVGVVAGVIAYPFWSDLDHDYIDHAESSVHTSDSSAEQGGDLDTIGGNVLSGSQTEEVYIPDLATVQSMPKISDLDRYVQEMSVRMRAEFAETIHLIATQVKLKGFLDDLLRTHPDDAEALFERIVRLAFPDLAEEIFSAIALMDDYESWLLSQMIDLNQMDLKTQQETLWAKRYDVFGEAAKAIWQQELSPEEEREQALQNTVAMLDRAYDMTMEERLYLLQNAFDTSYSATMSDLVLDTTGVMTQVFFRFDSVQKDLSQLAAPERQARINDIRRQLGYDEALIESMTEQDRVREVRWQNGYAYMEARDALTAQQGLSESDLEQGLAQLRKDFFGREAYTIAKEEEELGFFRYQRPRIYGWN